MFIFLSVDRCVGFKKNPLAIMNNTVANILMLIFVWTCVFSSRGLWVNSNSILPLEELSISFPKWLPHFIFPPAMCKGSVSASLPTLAVAHLF